MQWFTRYLCACLALWQLARHIGSSDSLWENGYRSLSGNTQKWSCYYSWNETLALVVDLQHSCEAANRRHALDEANWSKAQGDPWDGDVE